MAAESVFLQPLVARWQMVNRQPLAWPLDVYILIVCGYDGARNISGKFNGVQAIIKKTYPAALYVHCVAHSLNLAISEASGIQPMRNCLGTVEKLYEFFNTPKWKAALLNAIENAQVTPSAKSLKRLCAMRWVAKYEALDDFIELLQYVYDALKEITMWRDSAGTNAKLLLNGIDFDFLVALLTAETIFGYGLPHLRIFQKENIDLMEVVFTAENAISELQKLRKQSNDEFQTIYKKSKAIAETLCIQESMKRMSKMQKYRTNISTDSVEDFYRLSIFNPYFDYFINQLEARFLRHKSLFRGFMCLLKTYIEDERESFENLAEFHSLNVSKHSFAQLRLWKARLAMKNFAPRTAIEAFQQCNLEIYPNISKLLQILCTLPVSTSTVERSFSSLKGIKTYLRNSSSQNRLNGLAMLSIHKDVRVTSAEVINELAQKRRRIKLIL